MPFEQLLIHLGPADHLYITLGGRRVFSARVQNNTIIITSSTNTEYPPVDAVFYNQVLQRSRALPIDERWITSNYTDPNWMNCPCRNRSPWVAALIRNFP